MNSYVCHTPGESDHREFRAAAAIDAAALFSWRRGTRAHHAPVIVEFESRDGVAREITFSARQLATGCGMGQI